MAGSKKPRRERKYFTPPTPKEGVGGGSRSRDAETKSAGARLARKAAIARKAEQKTRKYFDPVAFGMKPKIMPHVEPVWHLCGECGEDHCVALSDDGDGTAEFVLRAPDRFACWSCGVPPYYAHHCYCKVSPGAPNIPPFNANADPDDDIPF